MHEYLVIFNLANMLHSQLETVFKSGVRMSMSFMEDD